MFRLSPWSKRSAAIGSILLVMAMFVACGDDDSDISTKPSDDSSSSVCEDCDDDSSSSSSSAKLSSSVTLATPCKTETEDNCEYGKLVDDRDGQTYKTVKIGNQWWMAENLNFETDSSFCYMDSTEYCEKFGRLYMWAAAVGKPEIECGYGIICSLPSELVQGVCPENWHLPSRGEWEMLYAAVGGESMVGKVLKSSSGWKEYNGQSGNGTDAFGFSALPVGYRRYDGNSYYEGYDAFFWSSTEVTLYHGYYAFGMDLYNGSDGVRLYYDYRNASYSVRCLKD